MTTADRSSLLASSHTIRSRAAEVLGAEALAIDELVDRLVEAGLVLGASAVDQADRVGRALDGNGAFSELDGQRWISVPALLDGTSWTTTVPAELAAIDCLPGDPDLGLLTWWALDHPLGLAGAPGAIVECIELDDGTDGLQGPAGWLERCADGWASVGVAGTVLTVAPLESVPGPTAAQASALWAVFERIAERDVLGNPFEKSEPVELVTAPLSDLLEEALVADRSAFTRDPIPPVDDLLGAAGLERVDHMVIPSGADPRLFRRWQRRRRLAAIHHLDGQDLDAAEILLAMSYRWIDGAGAETEGSQRRSRRCYRRRRRAPRRGRALRTSPARSHRGAQRPVSLRLGSQVQGLPPRPGTSRADRPSPVALRQGAALSARQPTPAPRCGDRGHDPRVRPARPRVPARTARQ